MLVLGQGSLVCSHESWNTRSGLLRFSMIDSIWMTGWQPSFHLLTKPIKSSRHRIYDILNESFGCALTGSYRLKKPLRQINLHSNPALVEFVKNWRAKHDLPDLDPDNEVGVNYCFPLAQGITFDADYAKDLKCENCRVALGEGVRSYASIKGLLYDSLSRLCDNCYVWKRRNPNKLGRSMLLEIRRKSDIRTFLMGLTSCTACGKPALPKGPDGSRRFHQHQDMVEICAKLCKLCLDLWKHKGAMHPIAQLHAPKDFAYACEICKTTKSKLFDFWLGKGNNRTSDFGKLVCHTCIPALMKRHGFSSGEISLFNSVTKALPNNVSASFPSERFSLSSGKLVYITNTYGSAWLEAAWAWLKKHAGIDLSTRDGVLIQRQKDALAEGLEITDEMIAVAQKKYAPGAPAKNGLKRKFVHLEEED